LALKRGVTVRPGALSDLELLYAMYDETARRDQFIIRPLDYYGDAWEVSSRPACATAHCRVREYADSRADFVPLHQARVLFLWHVTRLHRNLMAPHLLQWGAMRWARAQGCTVYDMWARRTRSTNPIRCGACTASSRALADSLSNTLARGTIRRHAHYTGSTPPPCRISST